LDYFNYQEDGQLWAEDVALSQLAEQYGTPPQALTSFLAVS